MFTFQRHIFYFFSRQTAPNNRSRLQSTPASANINNKNQHTVAVVNITDDSMFKDQELETGVENDKPKQTPQESERIRKAKEEEDRYKKELETLQLEERKKTDEKLTEEERLYAEQKALEEEKRRIREEKLQKIMNLESDDDDSSLGDLEMEDLQEILSGSDYEFEEYEDDEGCFAYDENE